MPRIIVSSRYLKSTAGTKKYNLVRYVATREGVETYIPEKRNLPSSKNQHELIKQLLEEFPEGVSTHEYGDYKSNPTMENASELITELIERNADVIGGRDILVRYMAERPGTVRTGKHGLFSDSGEEIILEQAMKNVAEHKGNVWSHVVSLRREDAERLGYNTPAAWRNTVAANLARIAEAQKIDLDKLRWYASFHNTAHHPHIHLLVYSVNPGQGYLTKAGIERIRSAFGNSIFKEELSEIYQEQTGVRDRLRNEAGRLMKELALQLQSGTFSDPQLERLIAELSGQLKSSGGKKVYGYLQPGVKKTVDEIVSKLAENPVLKKMYEQWCGLEQEKYQTYTNAVKRFPPLSENKVFKPVKNCIIQTVLNMDFTLCTPECELREQETELPYITSDEPLQLNDSEPQEEAYSKKKYYLKWSDEYKAACNALYNEKDAGRALNILQQEADKGNVLAVYDIGNMYHQGLHVGENKENAADCFKEALAGFLAAEPGAEKMQPYVRYRIGKMYSLGFGTGQNYQEAFRWLEKAADAGNKYAQYSLGSLYYYGNGVKQSFTEAFNQYKKSADKGNAYACYETAKMLQKGIGTDMIHEKAEEYFKKAYCGFMAIEQKNGDDKLLYRLGMMSLNGTGCEKNPQTAVKYLKKSAELNNENALCEYGKLLTEGKVILQDIEAGIKMLEKSAEKNENARYYLGRLYLKGEIVPQDIDKAAEYLKGCPENPYASYALGRLYSDDSDIRFDPGKAEAYFKKAVRHSLDCAEYALGRLYLREDFKNIQLAEMYLNKASEQNNEFAMYTLAKLYLGGEIPQNTERATELLERSAGLGNDIAAYALGKLYLFGGEIEKDREKALRWLNISAGAGNEYAAGLIENMHRYEQSAVKNAAMSMLSAFGRMIAAGSYRTDRNNRIVTERRLKNTIRRKKEALGLKEDRTAEQIY